MSETYIPAALRRQVVERARNCCEYHYPREQKWSDHFKLDGARIHPLTATGRVTVYLLRLNAEERVEEREILMAVESYPCLA